MVCAVNIFRYYVQQLSEINEIGIYINCFVVKLYCYRVHGCVIDVSMAAADSILCIESNPESSDIGIHLQ